MIKVNCFDRISFICEDMCMNNSFILVIPNLTEKQININNIKSSNLKKNEIQEKVTLSGIKPSNYFILDEKPDINLSNSWTIHEKDSLRKYILVYGYGKWTQIQKSSGGVLNDKPIDQLRIFTNCFINTIIELLPGDKNDMKRFLAEIIERNDGEPYVISKKDDWGSLIKDRAPAWAKRLQLICRVSILVEKFKKERKKNKEIRTKCQLIGNESDLALINKTFDHWDNLLNFIPNQALYGQRPAVWWNRTHDIDLLRGTYKHGYANYQLMRNDPSFCFSSAENETSFQEFPNADTITRRMKKLVQIIVKVEHNNGGIVSFEEVKNKKDPTGFNLEEKQAILKYLINKGIPINSQGRNDWNIFKEEILKEGAIQSRHSIVDYEKLVQKLRTISDIVLKLDKQEKKSNNSNKSDNSLDPNKLDELDPDKDGFEISPEDAEALGNNIDLLTFIRKNMIISSGKVFENSVEKIKSSDYELPENWDVEIHDKELLTRVAEKGFSILSSIEAEFIENSVPVTIDILQGRLNFLTNFFKDYTYHTMKKKKSQIREIQNELLNSQLNSQLNTTNNNFNLSSISLGQEVKRKKFAIEKDDKGKLIFPISVSPSLTILDIGKIDSRPNYHSEKNIFPIGFKSVREHPSMINPKERGYYTCEILDGGDKPIFKLTSHDDSSNPIIKDTCTGCWIVVCNRINDIQKNRKSKVTVSGTERFGLADINVCRILQSFPEIKECTKYKMKKLEGI